ncbi:MAG: thioredoxin family protein [Polyangiaceae bacterium]
MKLRSLVMLAAPLSLVLAACSSQPPSASGATSSTPAQITPSPANSQSTPAAADAKKAALPGPEIGKPAPDFTLTDLDGKSYTLSSLKGKVVVLEWFNPDCPFVKMSHSKGSLKGYADKAIAKGVTWLAINSAAPGKQGHDPERNRAGIKAFDLHHPVLVDPTGEVGHKYAATNTPQMFVIAADGTVAYRGAIDNSPDGEGESPEGGKLVNYVDEALTSVLAGKPVAKPITKPYGCGVKYGS